MNPATAFGRVFVDELIRCGVREAVLAPGSRSAPIALALADAAAAGGIRLHVRIDERTAGFVALGLACTSGRAVPVTCTSGTAAANLHPAVLEAHHAGVPLVAVTADRPPELRGSGANQTTEQVGIYGSVPRWAHDLATPEWRTGQNGYWRSTVSRAVASATDPVAPGPVHLNVPLREPLLPDGDADWCEPLAGRADGQWTVVVDSPRAADRRAIDAGRGLVVVAAGEPVPGWARDSGWPIVAETAGAGDVLTTGAWLLDDADFLAAHRPDAVVCVGRPTLFRSVSRLLADPAVRFHLITSRRAWPAPGHDVITVHRSAPALSTVDPGWAAAWHGADARARGALDRSLDAEREPSGLRVARDLVRSLPPHSLLVIGSSQPVRDVGLVAPVRDDVDVIANRGVAGIDGTVSTAVGAALAAQRDDPRRVAVLLLGDLAFLHDATGLVIGPGEPRPDLTIVVVDNGGGGIFALLEPGGLPDEPFERVFGTPTGVDFAALCGATRTPYRRLSTMEEMTPELLSGKGIRVLHVVVDRADLARRHDEIRRAIGAAVH
ncbi:MAG: 2-succinyl-5-enolpyruvyl-6-hydroxy-3-cyclohexene-1-carboxylic-acid synthase [Mycobacteriales bacterium]|nr:MAG: 2-succinyl-5-enolpyruvyl-6-hydroxy-3-cyclohexene-1-carboxylic-acid synthase [Pseudonocardiales bacterium]